MDDSLKKLRDDLQELDKQKSKLIDACLNQLNERYGSLKGKRVTLRISYGEYDGFFRGFEARSDRSIEPVIYGCKNDGTASKAVARIRMMPYESFSLELNGK